VVYKKKVPPDRADDLVQSFIQEKILGRNLLRLADPGKGKFRTFLLTALDRFLIDCWRKEHATRAVEELPSWAEGEKPSDVFDLAWAMQVLIESVRGMQAECAHKQRADLWGVFAGRALTPLGGDEALSYKLLAERFGLQSDKQAANRYLIAEAMFRRHVRAVLAEYSGGDVETEARDFRQIFANAGPELIEQLRIHLWDGIPDMTLSLACYPQMDRGTLTRLLELPRPVVDIAALLQQVLTAPVPLDLNPVFRQQEQGPSFSDLLHQPNPVPELLELVKDFAKENRTDPESPLGREVATVLYYASIAAALVRCGRRITRQEDATLRQGFEWGCERPWVDERTRELLGTALRQLNESQGTKF
jgi:RNA polymerase sigma-70 factor (ECF subfamily)